MRGSLGGMSVQWPAPAKLNLMLHITGRREDGYHLLQTVFQFIDFADYLEFGVRDDGRIRRHSNADFTVPADEDIIVRAAQKLREAAIDRHIAAADYGVDIHLQKNIPMGAGLGGGSSDAATTLLALNHYWRLGFSLDELADIGLELGADVPVFVRGFAAFAEGVGEKLQPVEPAENWYVLLIPPVHVSTQAVFENPDLTRDCDAIKLCDLSQKAWTNVCTPVVKKHYPEVSQAIDIINEYAEAKMSGTGASVFAAFAEKARAEQVLEKIRQKPEIAGWKSLLVRGQNQSSLHRFMAENLALPPASLSS